MIWSLFLVTFCPSLTAGEQNSKQADVNTLNGAFETVMRVHYPTALGRIAIRMVPCPAVCVDAFSLVSKWEKLLSIQQRWISCDAGTACCADVKHRYTLADAEIMTFPLCSAVWAPTATMRAACLAVRTTSRWLLCLCWLPLHLSIKTPWRLSSYEPIRCILTSSSL